MCISLSTNKISSGGRLPAAPPPFTLKDLRNGIPKHCFNRSLYTSFGYLSINISVVPTLFIGAYYYLCKFAGNQILDVILFPIYWFWQGAFMTGIWVIAHECGHGAFSSHKTINDSVGFTLHSLLLVPYFSW